MPDAFQNFLKLQEVFQANLDYRIESVNRGGRIIILAPHGGGIERGTSELVRAIASEDLSYYLFEGLMHYARESKKMHITSTSFDEPRCLEMLRSFETSIAIHGCTGKEPFICVGGKNTDLCNILVDSLKGKGYCLREDSWQYAGTDNMNICNRTANGSGVQLEFSTGFRRLLFVTWENRKGRRSTTEYFQQFVSCVRKIIL